ncbi:MAG: ABC transporter ATP-binding protein [Phycisphaerae bacterium]|jgi:ABC-2 type transport system ATP-binding protein|nr:ABC transporter ATP-binding protein [Phycisphaerae bacterium]
MPDAILEVSDYTKRYGDVLAVDRLSFRLEAGQVVGLVGPNGAGKTTTMRAIAGIIPPSSGTIRVGGHDVVNDPVEAKRRLVYVPDDPKLFDTLSVQEHLQFTASIYDVRDWKPKAEVLLERFELTPKRSALARELSRGMRQKLAICCAYLHEPKLVMFDEPMTGLDPLGIRTLKISIQECAARGASVLISSHLLALVEDLTTHLLILESGVRRFAGSLAEARASYATDGASLEEVFFRATAAPGSIANATPRELRSADGSDNA